MSGPIISLDAHRPDPHIVLHCPEGHAHVFPESWVRDLIAGKDVEPLEPCMLRAILARWLEAL